MKLQNRDIFQAREPLRQLINIKLPVKTSYQIAKLVSKLNEQLKVIEEVRLQLVKNHGEKDESGQMRVDAKSESFTAFSDEFNELMEQVVDIKFEKVRLPEKVAATCDACHHNMDKFLEIEASVLMALDKFVEV